MEGDNMPLAYKGNSGNMQRSPAAKISERIKELYRLRTVLTQTEFNPLSVFNDNHQ
jgi:hypothetical protein